MHDSMLPWDGTMDGVPQPSDVYIYKAHRFFPRRWDLREEVYFHKNILSHFQEVKKILNQYLWETQFLLLNLIDWNKENWKIH